MPGRDYSADQKVECARALDDLGLAFIQPAFPATGEADREVVARLAGTTDAEVVALARALPDDVDAAVEAGADVVETFAPVSDRHLEHLLGRSREEMLATLTAAVDRVQDRGGRPHVLLADAFRTDPADLRAALEAVPDVPLVTLADTVGARTPVTVRRHLDALDADMDRLGVHFHDDLDCATANVLAAYDAGVAKADVSVAGLGERAGNSPLEAVVAGCAVDRGDDLGVATEDLVPTCRSVLETLGEPCGERTPVLGERIHHHESGIHTAAMLADPATMEPYDPSRFGARRHLVFGRATGEGGARALLERAGVDPTDDRVAALRERLAEQGPMGLDEAVALASRAFGE